MSRIAPLPKQGSHAHDWERGAHMAEAFGVDGRRYYCAICGIPYWCMAQRQTPNLCDIHGGFWSEAETYCDRHEAQP